MINLQALEEKLNKVLETETKESLTTWLLQKRIKNLLNCMGEGDILPLNKQSFHVERIESYEFVIESQTIEFDELLLLAS
jgi:hypothetical protein